MNRAFTYCPAPQSHAFRNPFPDAFYGLPDDGVLPQINVSAGKWAPALPFMVFIQVSDSIRTLSREEATVLYHCLGRALDLEQ